ncbi:MAG: hypothetical protein D6722_09980 [Bacteroidetes bacterium]|nr:MAG: hypothetical protein D6722_09980 [Bacteroidota bacterium]
MMLSLLRMLSFSSRTYGLLAVSLLPHFLACQTSPPPVARSVSVVPDSLRYALPYDLGQPLRAIELPEGLSETSGIAYAGEGHLALIEDEHGRIYRYDIRGDSLEGVYPFGEDRDYEGIEVRGDTAWVLQSKGRLFQVAHFASDSAREEKIDLGLNEDMDFEGLSWGPGGRLLILAKEPPRLPNDEKDKAWRVAYAWPGPVSEPYVRIHTPEVAAFLQYYPAAGGALRDFDPEKTGSIKPSGIGIHPTDGHIYVIASAGSLLVVLSPDQRVVAVHPLPRELFPQPEGLCFGPDGTLYIASEGRGGPGRLLVFSPPKP